MAAQVASMPANDMAAHATDTATNTNNVKASGAVSNDLDTIVNYFKPPPEGLPYMSHSNVQILVGKGHMDPKPVHIIDARPDDMYKKFTMDKNGFQYVKHPSEHIGVDMYSDDEVKRTFYPETEELIKRVTGCKEAVAFQHVYRAHVPKTLGIKEGKTAGTGPLGRAHIDLSVDGAWTRLKIYSSSEEEAKQRYEDGCLMISVWRPMKTVYRDPLAVMDTQTLPDDDMVPFANPLTIGDVTHRLERLTIKPNPDHQWYYLHEQTPDDVLLVKFVDTRDKSARMTGCPHTAVVKPGTEDLPPRESLETRVMAFF